MQILDVLFAKIIGRLSAFYIDMVFNTSKIVKKGHCELLENLSNEQFVIAFWHGDSYCMYPILKGSSLLVVTTEDRRGDYISEISKCFGYIPVRIPDKNNEGRSLIRIRNSIEKYRGASIGVTLDGPLGPYHKPKDFPFITALLSEKRVLPISLEFSRKIQLKKRWDKYTIPLPFNKIKLKTHFPLKITKEDKKNGFFNLKEQILQEMENEG
ncbi:DUF374 domain-containing protein [uncultured Ilyobacter sp.]|uniref:lysophospholipid acyltransferase family protein n=1 Tax=uncultured Ilyobacter sp. TaxID=544433 RepID=UPI0029F5AA01|nr:DUF374 domain-containing protein [uncultured Ilyobacter sp.]